jgi:hypothetical protein
MQQAVNEVLYERERNALGTLEEDPEEKNEPEEPKELVKKKNVF